MTPVAPPHGMEACAGLLADALVDLPINNFQSKSRQ